MSNHSGTIHTVRFSPNGKYLASGADDKIVCVYTLDSNPPTHSTFGRFFKATIGKRTILIKAGKYRFRRGTSSRKLAHDSTFNRP